MISSGIPISEALESLAGEASDKGLRSTLKDILDQITKGITLTMALKSQPKYFNNYYVSLVEIGEESGSLEDNLKYLSDQLAKDVITRRKLSSATLYPGFVMFFALVIGGGISIFVLPKLVDFFSAFNVPLPATTLALLAFAAFMKTYGIGLFTGIIILIILVILFFRLKPIKNILDRISLRLPFLGGILRTYQLTRICRNMGTLLKSGVTIARALEVTSDSLTNSEYSDDLKRTLSDIEKGKTLYGTMKNYKIFPDLLTKMISVGEKSGNMDTSFLYLAEFYDGELDDLTRNLETVLEPVLLVVIGLIVGFLALSIISPIYELTGSIGVTTGAPVSP